jgi:hypothetical protein
MEVLIPILIALLIFAVVVWIISLLPLPSSPIPLKTILYVLAAIVLIVFLLRFIQPTWG